MFQLEALQPHTIYIYAVLLSRPLAVTPSLTSLTKSDAFRLQIEGN